IIGKLNARTSKSTVPSDPCSMKPSSGFKGLENQLYRIEIHTGGQRDNATFKWSRNNASFESKIESISGSTIKVTTTGKEDLIGFAQEQRVELIEEVSTLHNEPSALLKIVSVDPSTREIVVNNSVAQFADKSGLKLRSWDQPKNIGDETGIKLSTGVTPIDKDWISVEDGVEINFTAPNDGVYKSGDYWLIPARTATADIEWPYTSGSPVAQLPVGVKHYYAKLALIKAKDGFVVTEDCRELFPSLTDICAEDICFKNDSCDLSEAGNVQEALDLLCAANDLRDHNKHLHGYGVVCGLKVKCALNREFVTIENGYALDCDGNIIRLKNNVDTSYPVVAEAVTAKYLDELGNGEVCLSISYKGKNVPQISIEQYQPKSFWEEILEGSLIKDFFDEAIKPLVEFINNQISFPLTDEPPVPIGQQRLTALLNLYWQKINSLSGPFVFLSGTIKRGNNCDLKPEDKQNEDQLLFCLYQELKQLLSSKSFCAMFDNDHPYPDYLIDPGLDTMFGPALKIHTRLRLHPSGKFAYTSGMDNKIYVYDLKKLQLLQTLVFPSTSNIILQDLAVSFDGKEMYVIGTLDDKDTIFAIVKINATTGKHSWDDGSSVKCGHKYVILALHSTLGLFAVARGNGLYNLTGIGTNSFAEIPVMKTPQVLTANDLNPTGLIFIPIDGTNIAYVADNNTSLVLTEPALFTRISAVDLHAKSIVKTYAAGGVNDWDDLLADNNNLYVTGTAATRVLRAFNITTAALAFTTNLEPSTVLRLSLINAGYIDYMLVTLSDKYKVVRVNLKAKLMDAKFRIPVQLLPVAITTTTKRDLAYVLNSFVNTITVIDLQKTFKQPSPNYTEEPPHDIADYHDGVIAAYHDITKHFIQYLKDVFCDQFIIDCPTCTEKDKVYLGCVEIQNNNVYHMCNFSKRKYVKPFRTWGYWLSTVPILPALKKSFAEFCCKVLDVKKI